MVTLYAGFHGKWDKSGWRVHFVESRRDSPSKVLAQVCFGLHWFDCFGGWLGSRLRIVAWRWDAVCWLLKLIEMLLVLTIEWCGCIQCLDIVVVVVVVVERR